MDEGDRSRRGEGSSRYSLQPSRINNEDILLCVDVDPQSLVEMKGATGPNGRPLTRLDAIKQAIILFVNAKLTINPDHRFAFATLSNSVSWVRNPNPPITLQSIPLPRCVCVFFLFFIFFFWQEMHIFHPCFF